MSLKPEDNYLKSFLELFNEKAHYLYDDVKIFSKPKKVLASIIPQICCDQ